LVVIRGKLCLVGAFGDFPWIFNKCEFV